MDVAVSGAGDEEDLERQSGTQIPRVPRLAELARWATSILPNLDPDDPDDASASPLTRSVADHVATAVRRGGRLLDATGIPAGVQRVVAVG
jgi:hypothetical protein